jgi:uncharacterized protein
MFAISQGIALSVPVTASGPPPPAFHVLNRSLQIIAGLLRRGRPAAEVMEILAREEAAFAHALAKAGRNAPCPCGSGRKLKHCHGSQFVS